MKKAPKAPAAKKPVAKDLPAKRSAKGGSIVVTTNRVNSIAEATNLMTGISRFTHDATAAVIANIRA